MTINSCNKETIGRQIKNINQIAKLFYNFSAQLYFILSKTELCLAVLKNTQHGLRRAQDLKQV